MRLESNKIDNGGLNNINEDNFLDFLDDIQEINIFNDEIKEEEKPIENNNFSKEIEAKNDNEEQFKKFLVEKVMSDITNINFCDLDTDNRVLEKRDIPLCEQVEDNLTMTFNQFIEETLIPKFDIKNDMTHLYNLNNQNELEDLKKQATLEIINKNSQ